MIRLRLSVLAAAAALLFAGTAPAQMHTTYAPEKGIWNVTGIEVDPNHIDDYLAGLRRTQAPGMDVLKKRGLIDAYRIRLRNGYVKGSPNVMIETHFTSFAALAPDKARDQAIEKEIYASVPKEEGDKAVAGYEKYRTFVDDAYWTEVTLAK
ncbi:hypothetical protein [Sphingomonas solaris]|uniref:DUF4198 domain-containing protein n=1 Tax=Alterirhizorhabdus solaris TaxID=2529389 RepID=A0A558QW42_9SPHN|nr:hypothetical protein [Sphingomonas solaris]TVV71363.1 hypothetical protein FOY91_17040 [Sphingomonas solaris]